jgi:hypothetical protein
VLVRPVVVMMVDVVAITVGAVVVVPATTVRNEVAVATVTKVGSPSSDVSVAVSGPRYGCGTGSGLDAEALDECEPEPISAVSTSSIPSAANTNTYQGGRFPGPSPPIRTPLTDRVRRG